MKMLKNIGLSLLGILALHNIAKSQITLQEADEAVQNKIPQYTNIYTFNSPTMFQDPNTGEYTFIYTVGAGHHTDSTSTFLAGVTDSYNVTPEQKEIADNDPKRHLWTYDRNQYQDVQQFSDSLDHFLSKYFTITNSSEIKEEKEKIKFFPNPVTNYGRLETSLTNDDVTVYMIDQKGSLIRNVGKKINSDGKIDFEFNFDGLSSGVYNIILQTNENTYTTRVIKK